MTEPLIDAERVTEMFRDSLFTEGEAAQTTKDELARVAVIADGIMAMVGFNRERLESHRAEVTTMLQSLPLAFRPTTVVEANGATGGGGWSFLNACMDANDVQWTGVHRTMDQLFTLGIGLDLCAWALPRDMWTAFPGGMPYVCVKV